MRSGMAEAAGPNAHPFAVMRNWFPSASWDSRSATRRSWTFPAVSWTSRPASAGAAAAWRADGFPPLPRHHARQQGWWQADGAVGYLGNGRIELTGTGAGAQWQLLVIAPATGRLLADEYVTATAPRHVPASGARPGLTSCPGGKTPARQNICGTRQITRHGQKYLEMIALGPQLVLARGSLQSYDVVVRAGWTNAAPRLPAPSRRFSIATDGKG